MKEEFVGMKEEFIGNRKIEDYNEEEEEKRRDGGRYVSEWY